MSARDRLHQHLNPVNRHTGLLNLVQRALVKEQVLLVGAGPWTTLVVVRDQDSLRASFEQEPRCFTRTFTVIRRATQHNDRVGVVEWSFSRSEERRVGKGGRY